MPVAPHGREEWSAFLEDTLEALVEFVGASVGWVGIVNADGRLSFPARHGEFAEGWLTLQQGLGSVWGFEIREGPTLLNDLPPFAEFGQPSLSSILSCPVMRDGQSCGHVVLANKPQGFTSHDAAVLQGMAHLIGRRYLAAAARPPSPAPPPNFLRVLSNRFREGILVVNEAGALVFANAAWLRWTGFEAADLLNRSAPFPFWPSHRQLVALAAHGPTVTLPSPLHPAAGLLPFRCRDERILWCEAEVLEDTIDGQRLTVAFLHRGIPEIEPSQDGQPTHKIEPSEDGQPQVVATEVWDPAPVSWRVLLLQPAGRTAFWDESWSQWTGLSSDDVADAATELVLDWLFPRQQDRNWVADLLNAPGSPLPLTGSQALLRVVTATGNETAVCTFLPVPVAGARGWLLIAAEPAHGRQKPEPVRADPSGERRGPHAKPEWRGVSPPQRET